MAHHVEYASTGKPHPYHLVRPSIWPLIGAIAAGFLATGAIMFMHGSADPSVPITGVQLMNPQGGEPIRITLSVQDSVAAFARRNHCDARGTSTTFAESGRSPGTHVVRFTPHDCDAGAEVVYYLINGGGHTWPGADAEVMPADSFGLTNQDFRASETIWQFFSEHTLQPQRRR